MRSQHFTPSRNRKPVSSTLILIAVSTTSILLLAIFGYAFLYPARQASQSASTVPRSSFTFNSTAENVPLDPWNPATAIRGRPPTKTKIAYVFAGSVRSFTCPRVHWSLRWNLIDAMGGEAYTFIRTSVEDNANVKTGKGTLWTPEYNSAELDATLSILNPRKVEYFRLSTQLDEMRKLFPSMIHRVFQENDQRRYSMFFHRCMAYRMVVEYEKKHNMRFDWVALTRLDAAWLEPVVPIEMFSKDRVWLTETGYVPFNDQFMLIPREFADYLYDLDTKVTPKVYCLGGPDVETWKCRREQLEAKYPKDHAFINATLQHCCHDNTPKGANREGFSETIHFRHLQQGRIPVGFARLPVYITRLNKKGECLPECARLYHNFKQSVYEGLEFSYPFFAPLNALDNRMMSIPDTNIGTCTVLESPYSTWNPISAYAFQQWQAPRQRVNYGQNLYQQLHKFHPSIVFNSKLTIPWKIRTTMLVDRCLTANFTSLAVEWDFCRLHMRLKGGRRHHPAQSWYLHVRPHDDRILQQLIVRDHYDFLLPPHTFRPNVTQIYMARRDPRWFEAGPVMYCLTAVPGSGRKLLPRFNENITVAFRPCVHTFEENPQQFFLTVTGETFGTNGLTSTVGKIMYAENPKYCLVRDEDEGPEVRTSTLSLGACDSFSPTRKYFEFESLS